MLATFIYVLLSVQIEVAICKLFGEIIIIRWSSFQKFYKKYSIFNIGLISSYPNMPQTQIQPQPSFWSINWLHKNALQQNPLLLPLLQPTGPDIVTSLWLIVTPSLALSLQVEPSWQTTDPPATMTRNVISAVEHFYHEIGLLAHRMAPIQATSK